LTERHALWTELRNKVAKSLKDPQDAQYVANALFAWPEGHDLLRRLVAYLDTVDDHDPLDVDEVDYGRSTLWDSRLEDQEARGPRRNRSIDR
jgi:hypothetical protein